MVSEAIFPTGSARSKGEEKAILVSESGLFLTLGSGTSSARNENLRPLLNTNIPLISGKYGFRNHFWPPESRFLMSKSEKNAFFSKPFNGPILIFWNLILYTFLCTKIKKFTIVHFFSLDACSRPMWEMLSIGSYDILVLSLCCNDISNLTSTPINLHLFFAETSGLNTLHIAENALCRFPELKKVVILDAPPRIDSRNLASLSRHRSDYLAWRLPKSPHSSKIAFKSL